MKGWKYIAVVVAALCVGQYVKLTQEIRELRQEVYAARPSTDRLKLAITDYTEAVTYREKGLWKITDKSRGAIHLDCVNPRAEGYTSIYLKLSDRNRDRFDKVKVGDIVQLTPVPLLHVRDDEEQPAQHTDYVEIAIVSPDSLRQTSQKDEQERRQLVTSHR